MQLVLDGLDEAIVMSTATPTLAVSPAPTTEGLFKRLRRSEKGTTAIEFAMIALPFMMLLFGIITVGLYFFVTFTLENATEQAARLIRTGQVQTNGMSAAAFKNEVCALAPPFVDCTNKLRVDVKSAATPALAAAQVLNGSNLKSDGEMGWAPGTCNSYVQVTVFYEWTMTQILPFLKLGTMGNGSALIQAMAVFRSEPFC